MTTRSTAAAGLVGPIDAPRGTDVLAERLRQRILDGALVEGDALPSERAFMVDTGLGRASVREALRVLEAEALITPRLGRYGGWTVTRPGPDSISRTLDVFIRGSQVRFTSLLAAREAIEPSCAALAAECRTDADLERLDDQNARLASCWQDLPSYLAENVRWHLAIVDATHNEILIGIMSALGDAILAGTNIEDFNSPEVRRAALRAHEAVVDAIRAGDADAAYRRMHRHVHAFRSQASDAYAPGHVVGLAATDPTRSHPAR